MFMWMPPLIYCNNFSYERRLGLSGDSSSDVEPELIPKKMSHSIQVVARHDVAITAPTFGPGGELFAISQNGDIYKYFGNTE